MPGKVIVDYIQQGERKIGRIIVKNDDGKAHGVRPRWARVYAVGDDITEISPGEWILVEHGRWTHAHVIDEIRDEKGEPLKLYQVEWPESVMAASDVEPEDSGNFGEFAESYDAASMGRM